MISCVGLAHPSDAVDGPGGCVDLCDMLSYALRSGVFRWLDRYLREVAGSDASMFQCVADDVYGVYLDPGAYFEYVDYEGSTYQQCVDKYRGLYRKKGGSAECRRMGWDAYDSYIRNTLMPLFPEERGFIEEREDSMGVPFLAINYDATGLPRAYVDMVLVAAMDSRAQSILGRLRVPVDEAADLVERLVNTLRRSQVLVLLHGAQLYHPHLVAASLLIGVAGGELRHAFTLREVVEAVDNARSRGLEPIVVTHDVERVSSALGNVVVVPGTYAVRAAYHVARRAGVDIAEEPVIAREEQLLMRDVPVPWLGDPYGSSLATGATYLLAEKGWADRELMDLLGEVYHIVTRGYGKSYASRSYLNDAVYDVVGKVYRLDRRLGGMVLSTKLFLAYEAVALHSLWAGYNELWSIGTNILEATEAYNYMSNGLYRFLASYTAAVNASASPDKHIREVAPRIYVMDAPLIPVEPMPGVENPADTVARWVVLDRVLLAPAADRGTLIVANVGSDENRRIMEKVGADVVYVDFVGRHVMLTGIGVDEAVKLLVSA